MGRYFRGRIPFVVIACALAFGVQLRSQISGPPPPMGQMAGQAAETERGTGLITGRVVDGTTNRSVAGTLITIAGMSGSGAPLTEVLVGSTPASSGPPGAPRQLLTDGQGRFVFHDLAKGRYTIRTSAAGYVVGGYGQSRPNGPMQIIELPDDKTKFGDLTIRIWKFGTITGTVTDETGEPIVGVTVTSLRRTMVNGAPRFANSNSASTDDRGIYRLSALTPGGYVIAVMSTQTTMPVSTADAYMQAMSSGGNMTASDVYRDLMSSGGPYPSSGGHRVGDLIFTPGGSRGLGSGLTVPAPVDDRRMYVYPTTYYPAAASVDQAAVVKLASGDERSGADLQLKLVPGVRVSGMVTGPDGPVKNTGVKLYAVGVEALNGVFQNLESSSTVTDGSGAFTFLGVTPGQYTLKVIRVPRPIQPASAPSNMTSIEVSGPGGQMMMGVSMSGPGSVGPPLPLPPDPTLWASTSVNVADRDLDGIAVALRAGIRVSGRLQFEGTKTPPGPDQLQRATVMLTSSTETRVFGAVAPGSRVESDGRFHTQGFTPGRYQITASIPAAGASSAGWTLKSAMLEGRNLTDDPLALESDDVSGVVITFTDQTTQLVGSVVNSRGQPDKTAEVIVFPADSQSWRQGVTNARRIRTARASSAGNYELSNLPPGEYFAIAVSDDASGDTQDPKYLESLIGGTTRVTLADGEKKVQNLVSRGARQ